LQQPTVPAAAMEPAPKNLTPTMDIGRLSS
jgi:hypothetical protein